MSLLVGKNYLITVLDTELECPICTGVSNFGNKIERAKYPCFNTKCPKCNGKVTISTPMYHGQTKIWETNPPKIKNHEPLQNTSAFMINDIPVKKKLFDDNSDDEDEIFT